jgi:hypothetical protein
MEEKLVTNIFFTKIMHVVFSYFNYIMKIISKHLHTFTIMIKLLNFFPLFS